MTIIRAGSLTGGQCEGASHGPASISIILSEADPGEGPRLHRHTYDETWVIEKGILRFQAGESQAEARRGDIVIVSPTFLTSSPTRGRGGRG